MSAKIIEFPSKDGRKFKNFFALGEEEPSVVRIADKAKEYAREAKALLVAGLALVYWNWSGDDLTLIFRLPKTYLHYRNQAHHAHVGQVMSQFKTCYAPTFGKELVRSARESGANLAEKDEQRMQGSIFIRSLYRVVTPEEPDCLVVQFKTGQWVGLGSQGRKAEVESYLQDGVNDEDFKVQFEYVACGD